MYCYAQPANLRTSTVFVLINYNRELKFMFFFAGMSVFLSVPIMYSIVCTILYRNCIGAFRGLPAAGSSHFIARLIL